MILKQRKLKKLNDEVWKVVPSSNDRYFVSNYGRIKSFAYNKKDGRIMKCSEVKGFKAVQLKINKVPFRYYVHKLVAEIWIPKPSEKHIYVTHLDRNLKNNHISNLEWLTQETLDQQYREYFKQKYNASRHPKIMTNNKLNEKDIKLLKSMLQRGVVQAMIAKMFCISEMQVTRIKRGENWGHVQP